MITDKPALPLKTAIAGIGGFGSAHHGIFAELEKRGTARVVATCDPALNRLSEICRSHRFAERGVWAYDDFEEMLGTHPGQIDLGVVATPIALHERMHAAFLRDGAACYLEKPPTLDPREFARMLAVEESASVPSNVGFGYIHLEDRINLKRRMMTGEFGTLKRLSFLGLAQREPSYFRRNNWAGTLILGESLVLDSCLGNAMAHFVNNLLFWSDQEQLHAWARPTAMSCELYRANPIEGTDTIFARAELETGVEMRIAATHACSNREPLFEESIEFEHATILIRSATEVTIQRSDGPIEAYSIPGASLETCVQDYCDFLTGKKARPAQTLRDCLGFVETNALFYLAGQNIHDLTHAVLIDASNHAVVLPEVESAARQLIGNGRLPSESGVTWARPGGTSPRTAIPALEAVVRSMKSARGAHRVV